MTGDIVSSFKIHVSGSVKIKIKFVYYIRIRMVELIYISNNILSIV